MTDFTSVYLVDYAVGRERSGDQTATFDVVDDNPVLQPDGWAL